MLMSEIKESLESNICYFATASVNGKPNVVPIGLVKVISDSEILIVDVLFNKTRKNLEENPQIALAVTDVNKLQAYQIKGKVKIVTSGDLFRIACQLTEEKFEKRRKMLEERLKAVNDPEMEMRIKEIMERRLKPKAAIIVEVEEVYSTMPSR